VTVSGCSDNSGSGSGQYKVSDTSSDDSSSDDSSSSSNYNHDSGINSYVLYDTDFIGTIDFASNEKNYFIVPIMQGDEVDILANSDSPARFLVGGQNLLYYYFDGASNNMYNGFKNYEIAKDVSSLEGSKKYHEKITIEDPQIFNYALIFAVQDTDNGDDVSGHVKIKVCSEYSKDKHNQVYNSIMNTQTTAINNQIQRSNEAYDIWKEYMDNKYSDENIKRGYTY
jgi:hypothetical protein